MDEKLVEIARNLIEQFERFLKACNDNGDTTIDDVFNRLEDLKKET